MTRNMVFGLVIVTARELQPNATAPENLDHGKLQQKKNPSPNGRNIGNLPASQLVHSSRFHKLTVFFVSPPQPIGTQWSGDIFRIDFHLSRHGLEEAPLCMPCESGESVAQIAPRSLFQKRIAPVASPTERAVHYIRNNILSSSAALGTLTGTSSGTFSFQKLVRTYPNLEPSLGTFSTTPRPLYWTSWGTRRTRLYTLSVDTGLPTHPVRRLI